MKRTAPLLALLLLSATFALADEQTRNVQNELKTQGFYYGEADGKGSAELGAALRRYQIRNGLEVTGTLNKETSASLGLASAPPAPAAKSEPPKSPVARVVPRTETPSRPPTNLRRNEPTVEADEDFLRRDSARPRPPSDTSPLRPRPSSDPAIVRPPVRFDESPIAVRHGEYADLFDDTPYAAAPRVVQEGTLRRAQALFKSRGLYRDAVDGVPGPATEEAILSFQRATRLPATGRLDLETLNALRLLPGRGPGNPSLTPFSGSPPPRAARPPTYRGIWVQ